MNGRYHFTCHVTIISTDLGRACVKRVGGDSKDGGSWSRIAQGGRAKQSPGRDAGHPEGPGGARREDLL